MADAPVILLAFANDTSQPLDQLSKEDDAVNQALRPGVAEKRYMVIHDSFSTLDKMSGNLRDFKDQVILFHYGGHAESDALILEDGSANATGIGGLLGGQSSLKLVFLNGCSTLEQVKILRGKGIPAVIATSVPINDQTASNFSREFYESLSKGMTLGEAFDHAASFAGAQTNKVVKQFRGGFEMDTAQAEFPWGLYYEDDDILNWKLPAESYSEIVIQSYGTQSGPTAVVNEVLTSVMLEAIAPYSKNVRRLKEDMEEDEEEVDIRRVRQEIMDAFPAPVGEQIRKLFAADDKSGSATLDTVSEERLNQLLLTYTTITELIAFAMLTQLWDEMYSNPQIKISPENKKVIAGFFNLKSGESDNFDFVKLISSLRKTFDENNIDYFIEELKEAHIKINEDPRFQEGYEYLKSLKDQIKDPSVEISRNIATYCIETEEHLANMFRYFGFIVKYKLISIKNIDLVTRRNKDPEYQHYQVKLDKVSAGYLDDKEVYPTYTANKAVIIAKTVKDMSEYLSLSPFVVDENAYTGHSKAKLFFFTHYDQPGDAFHYKFTYIPKDKLKVDQQSPLNVLREQFIECRKLLSS